MRSIAGRLRSPPARCPWWSGGRPEGSLSGTWGNGVEAPPQKTLCQAWPRPYRWDTSEPRPSLWLAGGPRRNRRELPSADRSDKQQLPFCSFSHFPWNYLTFSEDGASVRTHSQLISLIFPPADGAGGRRKRPMSLHQHLRRNPCHWTQTDQLHVRMILI